jgi:hypothetical protein
MSTAEETPSTNKSKSSGTSSCITKEEDASEPKMVWSSEEYEILVGFAYWTLSFALLKIGTGTVKFIHAKNSSGNIMPMQLIVKSGLEDEDETRCNDQEEQVEKIGLSDSAEGANIEQWEQGGDKDRDEDKDKDRNKEKEKGKDRVNSLTGVNRTACLKESEGAFNLASGLLEGKKAFSGVAGASEGFLQDISAMCI